MARQLSLALPPNVSLGAEDYFVSAANEDAYRLVTEAPWPEGKLVLVGPEDAGKSHLARVWAAQTDAVTIPAEDLAARLAARRPADGACVVIENADRMDRDAEEPLFHLHNRLKAAGGRLLLTARTPPVRWGVALRDLASRMRATTLVQIDNPDADLWRAVLLKQFADRQLHPAPRVIDYLCTHLPRSFAAAAQAVERLDVMALSQKSAITLSLARSAAAEMAGTSELAEDGVELDNGPAGGED